jgi:hypothetical protein
MPQVQITPEQIPAIVAQHKAERAAIEEVLAIKTAIVAKLDEMEGNIAAGSLSAALTNFVEIQRIEYGLTLRGLGEKLKQIESVLAQLDGPILQPHGFRVPKA